MTLDSEPMCIEPVTLEGQYVRLEPLTVNHYSQLCEVGIDEDIWRWFPVPVQTPEDLYEFIDSALKDQMKGLALPFATIEKASNRAIGSTRFANIDRSNRRVEIGWTWIGKKWQRTSINTEAKYLMLQHAFETWGCIRVELKTDSLNEQSRKAILRIGAKEEGVFRNHMITSSGRIRHSVYYSVIDTEWSIVKTKLQEKLH
jgi:N-acetyltransferase